MIITVIAILIAVLIIIVVTNIGNNSSGNNKKPHTYEPWVIEAPEKRAGRRGEHIATEIIKGVLREGYVILIRSNSPVQSTYILQSVEDIDRAIHTFKRNHLSRDTVESIKKMLV